MRRGQSTLVAERATLQERFGDHPLLLVPLFQRRYTWSKKHIDPLWSDIDSVLDEESPTRFLGALVYDDDAPTTAAEPGRMWVIDGQQRLTTIYLSLVAIAQLMFDYGDEGALAARHMARDYLLSSKRETEGQPKLVPGLRDTSQFHRIMREALGGGRVERLDLIHSREIGEDEGKLTKAYSLLKKHVRQHAVVGANDEPRPDAEALDELQRLRDVLLEALEFVEIRLGDQHDPNEVFDRLNYGGEDLGLLDLVRNEVLKRLGDDAKSALRLWHDEWKPFEQGFEDDRAASKYFYPYALTIDPTLTTAGTFEALVRRWNPEGLAADGEPETAESQLQAVMRDLRHHQSSFNAIHSGRPSDLERLDEDLQRPVERLVRLGRPSSCYPYVMSLLTAQAHGEVATDDAVLCLGIIESFLIRRALVGLEPTGLHAIFKSMWRDAKGSPAEVRSKIVSKTITFPDDESVARGVEHGDLYHRKVCRYILEEYERGYTAGDRVALQQFDDMTVDHVLPQTLREEWAKVFSKEEHALWVDTWANLVPLSGPANSQKGTRSWSEAQAALGNETVFSTTKHLYDEVEAWTPQTLESRSRQLSAWALRRWPDYTELM